MSSVKSGERILSSAVRSKEIVQTFCPRSAICHQVLKDRLMTARNGSGKPNTIMARFAKGMAEAQVDAAANDFGKIMRQRGHT